MENSLKIYIYIYIYILLNHFAVYLKLTQYCVSVVFQLKRKNFWGIRIFQSSLGDVSQALALCVPVSREGRLTPAEKLGTSW